MSMPQILSWKVPWMVLCWFSPVEIPLLHPRRYKDAASAPPSAPDSVGSGSAGGRSNSKLSWTIQGITEKRRGSPPGFIHRSSGNTLSGIENKPFQFGFCCAGSLLETLQQEELWYFNMTDVLSFWFKDSHGYFQACSGQRWAWASGNQGWIWISQSLGGCVDQGLSFSPLCSSRNSLWTCSELKCIWIQSSGSDAYLS